MSRHLRAIGAALLFLAFVAALVLLVAWKPVGAVIGISVSCALLAGYAATD